MLRFWGLGLRFFWKGIGAPNIHHSGKWLFGNEASLGSRSKNREEGTAWMDLPVLLWNFLQVGGGRALQGPSSRRGRVCVSITPCYQAVRGIWGELGPYPAWGVGGSGENFWSQPPEFMGKSWGKMGCQCATLNRSWRAGSFPEGAPQTSFFLLWRLGESQASVWKGQ